MKVGVKDKGVVVQPVEEQGENIIIPDSVPDEVVTKEKRKGKVAVKFKITKDALYIIDAFQENLVKQNKCVTTINSYMFDVKSFVEFFEKTNHFRGPFTDEHVQAYLLEQKKSGSMEKTIMKRENSIFSFSKYLSEKGFMAPLARKGKGEK